MNDEPVEDQLHPPITLRDGAISYKCGQLIENPRAPPIESLNVRSRNDGENQLVLRYENTYKALSSLICSSR